MVRYNYKEIKLIAKFDEELVGPEVALKIARAFSGCENVIKDIEKIEVEAGVSYSKDNDS